MCAFGRDSEVAPARQDWHLSMYDTSRGLPRPHCKHHSSIPQCGWTPAQRWEPPGRAAVLACDSCPTFFVSEQAARSDAAAGVRSRAGAGGPGAGGPAAALGACFKRQVTSSVAPAAQAVLPPMPCSGTGRPLCRLTVWLSCTYRCNVLSCSMLQRASSAWASAYRTDTLSDSMDKLQSNMSGSGASCDKPAGLSLIWGLIHHLWARTAGLS
jgi:hypothetical protein